MPYEYTDERRAAEAHAQPDVEVFQLLAGDILAYDDREMRGEPGFYYAFGFPGCLWDSDPTGPFPTYEEALEDARSHGDCFEDYAPEEEEPKA